METKCSLLFFVRPTKCCFVHEGFQSPDVLIVTQKLPTGILSIFSFYDHSHTDLKIEFGRLNSYCFILLLT